MFRLVPVCIIISTLVVTNDAKKNSNQKLFRDHGKDRYDEDDDSDDDGGATRMSTCYNLNGDRTMIPYTCPEGSQLISGYTSFCNNDDKKKRNTDDPACSDSFCCESDNCPIACKACPWPQNAGPLFGGACPAFCVNNICGNTIEYIGGIDCTACGPCAVDTSFCSADGVEPLSVNTARFEGDPPSVAVTGTYDIPRDEDLPALNPKGDGGWYFKGSNSLSTSKINWYFYQAVDGALALEYDLYPGLAGDLDKSTLSRLNGVYAHIKLYDWSGASGSLPFFSAYTAKDPANTADAVNCQQNCGSGAAGSTWYKERRTLTVKDFATFVTAYGTKGALTSFEYLAYYGNDLPTLLPNIPHIELDIACGTTCYHPNPLPSDKFLYIALSTSSGRQADPAELALLNYGWAFGNSFYFNELVAP